MAAVAYVALAAIAIRVSAPERALGFPRLGARAVAPAFAEEPVAEPSPVS